MKIVTYPDPRLLARTTPLDSVTDEARERVRRMFELMYEEGGVGLAAPQVGWSVRLFVMNETGDRAQADREIVCVNPRILRRKGRIIGPEGCLSFPGIFVDVERSARTVVAFLDEQGTERQELLEDFSSRVFQHELDHLDNVLLIHRMTQADQIRHRDALEELKRSHTPIG